MFVLFFEQVIILLLENPVEKKRKYLSNTDNCGSWSRLITNLLLCSICSESCNNPRNERRATLQMMNSFCFPTHKQTQNLQEVENQLTTEDTGYTNWWDLELEDCIEQTFFTVYVYT